MNYVFAPPPSVSAPVTGTGARFPVHRIYCVGSNYRAHAQEMGRTGREPPVFFMKPADALLAVEAGETGVMPYPSLTANLHHEVELVVAIGVGGRDIEPARALEHVFGYAVGLDMTRRDLQAEMKKRSAPWCIGKGFDHAAPLGPITPRDQAGAIEGAEIALRVEGVERQRSRIDQMIWSVPEILAHLSAAWTLAPGDLIFTGTPAGVGPVARGERMEGTCSGLETLRVQVR